MITFIQLKEKGYQIEVNTTGAMIVDVIGQDDMEITDLENAIYTQKDIIFDDVEQTYDLVNIATDEIVFHTDDYDKLVAKIKELIEWANKHLSI